MALHYLKYPTFDWLSAAKIVPSNTTTYKLKQFQDALTTPSGGLPYVCSINYVRCYRTRLTFSTLTQIGCSGNKTADGRTVISEVWYYGHHIGRVVSHLSVALEASLSSIGTNLWLYCEPYSKTAT